jgi:bifunctional DNase/RNase
VDSRPSDAVALAIRFSCPIYTTEEVLDKAGLILEKEDDKSTIHIAPKTTEPKEKPSATLAELEKQLEEAVKNEDYEKAAALRDQISKWGK